MKTNLQRRFAPFLTAAMAAFVVQNLAMTQTNTFVAEQAIQAIPMDVEVTPNGKVAVVRGNTTSANADDWKVSVWRTDTGARLLPPAQNLNRVGRGFVMVHPTTAKPMVSDAVAVTNDRIIAIGSADKSSPLGEDTTYVDILSITYDAQGNPSVDVLQTHQLDAASIGLLAGAAHDVAITPDGARAVVNHQNWIHVFDLASGLVLRQFQIGGSDSVGNYGPCFPYWARNSVEVTNARAVVTTNRSCSLVATLPWVYIVNLATDPPSLPLEDDLTWAVMTTDQGPHDLAITPSGGRAVVTTTGQVALYDLTTNVRLGTPHQDSNDERHWSFTLTDPVPDLWHSVEVSDTHAVVLANRYISSTNFWGVKVFSITGTGPGLLANFTGTIGNDTAWDLDLSGDGVVATIKTQLHDLAVLNVPNAASTPLFKAGPSGGPPNYPSTSSGTAQINDATVILAPTEGDPNGPRWAAFLGKSGTNQTSQATLRFYNLSATSWPDPGPAVRTYAQSEATPTAPYLNAADLGLSPSGTDVLVRLQAPFPDPPPFFPEGVDWSRWTGNPPVEVPSKFGGSGICVAADSLRARRGTAVSISRHATQSTGWVHIVAVR